MRRSTRLKLMSLYLGCAMLSALAMSVSFAQGAGQDEETPPAETVDSVPDDGFPIPTPSAIPTPAPTPTATPTPGPGTPLLLDNFDDPGNAALPTSSGDPTFRAGYVAGQYQMTRLDPSARRPKVILPGQYPNASIKVDVQIVGATESTFAYAACRGGDWRLDVYPASGSFRVARSPASGGQEEIRQEGSSPAIRPETNSIELNCAGTNISGLVNGTQIFATQGGTGQDNRMYIGAGSGPSGDLDVRFDNLVVTLLVGTAPSSPSGISLEFVSVVPSADAPARMRVGQVAYEFRLQGVPGPLGDGVLAIASAGGNRVPRPGWERIGSVRLLIYLEARMPPGRYELSLTYPDGREAVAPFFIASR